MFSVVRIYHRWENQLLFITCTTFKDDSRVVHVHICCSTLPGKCKAIASSLS